MTLTTDPNRLLAQLQELHHLLDLMSPSDFEVLQPDLLKAVRIMMALAAPQR